MIKNSKFDYGKRIRQLRLLNNISAGNLAKELGMAQPTISRIETNSAYPSLQLLERICDYFSISIEEFFSSNEKDSFLNSKIYNKIALENVSTEELIEICINIDPSNEELIARFKNQNIEIEKSLLENKKLFRKTLISIINSSTPQK